MTYLNDQAARLLASCLTLVWPCFDLGLATASSQFHQGSTWCVASSVAMINAFDEGRRIAPGAFWCVSRPGLNLVAARNPMET
jgi:hypothetical protein